MKQNWVWLNRTENPRFFLGIFGNINEGTQKQTLFLTFFVFHGKLGKITWGNSIQIDISPVFSVRLSKRTEIKGRARPNIARKLEICRFLIRETFHEILFCRLLRFSSKKKLMLAVFIRSDKTRKAKKSKYRKVLNIEFHFDFSIHIQGVFLRISKIPKCESSIKKEYFLTTTANNLKSKAPIVEIRKVIPSSFYRPSKNPKKKYPEAFILTRKTRSEKYLFFRSSESVG